MASKAELQRRLEVAEIANGRLTRDVERLRLDNAAHRARETSRMLVQHAEQQRARQEAEREDKRKRRQELADGMLRLADATEWAIVADERGKVLELTVPLSADVEPIVHGVLTKKPKPGAAFRTEIDMDAWQRHVQDSINKMSANVLRARHAYGF